jgi:aryl-alcohol dehydrogenase-like predicted oxidoreductase
MNYRTLGHTNMLVSEIGFGAWGIGGDAYGVTDDNESVRALNCAVDQGINFFDTSDFYGAGHSESLLGKTISSKRDKVIIATKGGGKLPENGQQMPQDFTLSHLQHAFENSLRRLNSTYVDVYQLHNPKVSDLTDELIQYLEAMKQQGKARAIGVSLRSPQDGAAILARHRFDVIQVNFNLIDQRALETGLLAEAHSGGIGVIVRTPFNFGFLTGGSFDIGEKDHRASWPKEQLEKWSNAILVFKDLYGHNHRSKVQLALKFCLSFDGVSTVIPGMLNCSQVMENVAASDRTRLDANEIAAIRKIYSENTFMIAAVKQKVLNQRYAQ